MKLEYIKPEIEELKIELEASFANGSTGVKIDDKNPYDGEDWD